MGYIRGRDFEGGIVLYFVNCGRKIVWSTKIHTKTMSMRLESYVYAKSLPYYFFLCWALLYFCTNMLLTVKFFLYVKFDILDDQMKCSLIFILSVVVK